MKKILSIILTALMLVSAFATIPAFATTGGDQSAGGGSTVDPAEGISSVSNLQQLAYTDFSTISTKQQLNDAGWTMTFTADYTGMSNPAITYLENGVKINTDATGHLLFGGVQFSDTNNYMIDFTYEFNKNVWIQAFCLGYKSATVAPTSSEWTTIDGNSCIKIRGTTAIDSWTYYSDENYFHEIGGAMDDAGVEAVGLGGVDVRVRMLITQGGGKYAFITVGDDLNYYVVRANELNRMTDSYFGITHIGSQGESRGVIMKEFAVYSYDPVDVTGGSTVTAEKDKAYTDKNATYYKDGYVLHNMDFSKVSSFADTGYSFTTDSATERVVDVRNGKLYMANKSDTAAYMIFTGNAIPQAITEYTVTYKFRFLDGGDKPYLSFIRGLKLDSDNARDRSRELDVYHSNQSNATKDSYIDDCTPDNTDKWAAIAADIMDYKEVSIMISSISRKIDKVMIKSGSNTVTFKMDSKANKTAYDGYLGLKLSPKSAVEVRDIMVVAGAYDYIKETTWPTGAAEGDLVQNVLAEAVSTGTKPTYPDPAAVVEDNDDSNNDDGAASTTAPAADDSADETEATEEEKKKGCKSSIAIAVPALVVTTVLGCAVSVKKKED